MRYLFLLLFSISAFSMGPARPIIPSEPTNPTNPVPTPPPAASQPEAYLERFMSLASTYSAVLTAKTVSFSFREFFGGTIGMCQYNGSGRNLVSFSSSAWRSGSDTFKEMLSFHELGHCLLGRGHKGTKHSDGRFESIMNSYIFSQKTYLAYRDEYLKELFTAENLRHTSGLLPVEEMDPKDGCRFGK